MLMHPELDSRLKKWRDAALEVQAVEHIYRQAEATRKSIFAQMFQKAEGKSIAEREYAVLATQEWIDLAKALGKAEAEYNFAKMKYEICQNAYYGLLAGVKRVSDPLEK